MHLTKWCSLRVLIFINIFTILTSNVLLILGKKKNVPNLYFLIVTNIIPTDHVPIFSPDFFVNVSLFWSLHI